MAGKEAEAPSQDGRKAGEASDVARRVANADNPGMAASLPSVSVERSLAVCAGAWSTMTGSRLAAATYCCRR
ncbi:hypothetical protein ACQY74_001782 [Rhizobium leguminosarum bv. trifolii]